jgi:hypothetical protein
MLRIIQVPPSENLAGGLLEVSDGWTRLLRLDRLLG